jgi:hypothetical protein
MAFKVPSVVPVHKHNDTDGARRLFHDLESPLALEVTLFVTGNIFATIDRGIGLVEALDAA